MSSFVLFLSLILNGIAILAIINLYLRQNRLLDTERKLETTIKEMETIIFSYLIEMKDENAAFIERFQQLHANSEQQLAPQTKTVHKDTNHAEKSVQEDGASFPPLEHTSRLQAISSYQKTVESGQQTESAKRQQESQHQPVEQIRTTEISPEPSGVNHRVNAHSQLSSKKNVPQVYSIEEQIVFLQQQGLSIEEIAKKLNKGKTEIELMIKLKS